MTVVFDTLPALSTGHFNADLNAAANWDSIAPLSVQVSFNYTGTDM